MSVRRNVRLRREYLYRKGLEGKERALYEHKQQLKEAIRSGKAIPTELRSVEKNLRNEMEYDDDVHEKPLNHIDDEYKNAGMFDPKIAITTSRDPSARLKQFAQEIRLIFPNAIRLNRGAHTVGDVSTPPPLRTLCRRLYGLGRGANVLHCCCCCCDCSAVGGEREVQRLHRPDPGHGDPRRARCVGES
ncbi:unnamed protein product [Phytophthora fragariaefolia]|uniref:Unnamed protein product n=1 Tax=Phytophthora fragariaefolia TaxID=1490495 RepID=A0A9W6WU51_9STRA|nr:unnamed protein product [Phytophthora fragariaefolia]